MGDTIELILKIKGRGSCAVPTCNNQGQHLVPHNVDLRRQWLKALKIDLSEDEKPRKFSYICSDHFKPTDFIITPPLYEGEKTTKRLKKKRVPSIFPWTIGQKKIQEPVSPLDDVRFDPTLTSKTYSRPEPAISFVEEIPFMVFESSTQEPVADPLQLSDGVKDEIILDI